MHVNVECVCTLLDVVSSMVWVSQESSRVNACLIRCVIDLSSIPVSAILGLLFFFLFFFFVFFFGGGW